MRTIRRLLGKPPIWPSYMPRPISPMILDNLGLIINITMLEAWPSYQEACYKHFGTNRISRWLMYWVHPRLFPHRHLELKLRWVRERNKMWAEHLAALIEIAEREEL